MSDLLVLLDGVDVTTSTYAPVEISWGRDHPGDSHEPRRCSLGLNGDVAAHRGQRLQVTLNAEASDPTWDLYPGQWSAAVGTWAGQRVTVALFDGAITDTSVSWNGDPPRSSWHVIVDVIAVDPVADLSRLPVGDTPWPQESVSARAARIAALTPLSWSLDPSSTLVAARDVDLQPALDLMDELAHTASISGGVFYDPAQGLARLMLDASRKSLDPDVQLNPNMILIDATEEQTVGDVVNDVSVQYVNPADLTAQPFAHVTIPDSIAQSGRRSKSITTALITAADATARAQSETTRFAIAANRWTSVTLDSRISISTAVAEALMRAGPWLRVRLVDLPAPAETPWDGYLEGWSLTVDGPATPDARCPWRLELKLSPATWSGPLVTWARAVELVGYAVNPNPSFEAAPYYTGWIIFWRSPPEMTASAKSDGTAADGLTYVRATMPATSTATPPGQYRFQTLDAIAVAPGQVWHMAAKVRTADPTAYVVFAGALGATKEGAQYFASGALGIVSAHYPLTSDGAWHDVDTTVTIPAGYPWARFDLAAWMNTGASVDVDAIRFYLPTATGRWSDVATPFRWMDALDEIEWSS